MLMAAGACLSSLRDYQDCCLSNHGLAPVVNGFHAFGTVGPGCAGCDGAGLALRKSFTALAGSLSHLLSFVRIILIGGMLGLSLFEVVLNQLFAIRIFTACQCLQSYGIHID